jgi:NAD(P)-dependent dehydrogenase (short-subunit alcohol dehydrogenase family)
LQPGFQKPGLRSETNKLNGKVAIITGSGRGIDRAIALKLSPEGASVVINDLDEAPAQPGQSCFHLGLPASETTQ